MAVEIAAALAPLSTWFAAVNHTVTEPYLDEVFHIRQAQHYCQNHFEIWDPKITTPPGLYLLSYLFSPILGCSISALRFINALCLLGLLLVLRATFDIRRKTNHEDGFVSKILVYHSSLNIVLFPPLFFFSALYYTDMASTLSVVLFYWYFLRDLPEHGSSIRRDLTQVLLGVLSLMFRQTNIFWIAVLPTILTLVAELDSGHRVVKESMYRRAEGFGDSMLSVARTSWKMEVVYDPPIRDAFFEDYIRTLVSLASCAIKAVTKPARLFGIIRSLAPCLTLIGLFGSFILTNGSVVLGDKSNHVATPNIPQILYYWAFLAFFSWPLLLPQFLILPLVVLSRLSKFTHLEPLLLFRRRFFLPRIRLALAFTFLACAIVYLNTTVHPFLLADNRHYYFYIFRLLLRPWWMRYAVTPLYIFAAWASIETRGEPASTTPQSTKSTSTQSPPNDPLVAKAHSSARRRPFNLPDGRSTGTVSFVLTTTFTTALTLCTAPLVEPRYCIVPFIMWRMHLPLYSPGENADKQIAKSGSWRTVLAAYDYRVALETIWFLVINAVTGYIFINWTFEWPSEPGKAQRFMW